MVDWAESTSYLTCMLVGSSFNCGNLEQNIGPFCIIHITPTDAMSVPVCSCTTFDYTVLITGSRLGSVKVCRW